MVAVSGGVDSMVLLDALCQLPGVLLTVAHFEHGIRADSDEDRKLVEQTAKRYSLPFAYEHGNLGANANEAAARAARYDFLRRVQQQTGAAAILTAHHRDDVLETAVFNLLRGTGRKGLAPLGPKAGVTRPFTHIYKKEIVAYAWAHRIVWREDSTNSDETYTRNYIRRIIITRLNQRQKQLLETHILRAEQSNQVIDRLLDALLAPTTNRLARRWFIMLPHQVAREVMATWLRQNGCRDFDRKKIECLVTAAKVALPGKTSDINRDLLLHVGTDSIEIRQRRQNLLS